MKEAPIDYVTLWGEDEPEPSAKPDRNFFDEHQAICDLQLPNRIRSEKA